VQQNREFRCEVRRRGMIEGEIKKLIIVHLSVEQSEAATEKGPSPRIPPRQLWVFSFLLP
jgi:hypothetical protein